MATGTNAALERLEALEEATVGLAAPTT